MRVFYTIFINSYKIIEVCTSPPANAYSPCMLWLNRNLYGGRSFHSPYMVNLHVLYDTTHTHSIQSGLMNKVQWAHKV